MDSLPVRPDWHSYFHDIAEAVSARASCLRAKVGAVAVDPMTHRILATGYNGGLSGEQHCTDPGVGCLMVDGHCRRTLHAEQNILIAAARFGISLSGAEVYITINPCHTCERMLLAAGVVAIHYRARYTSETIEEHNA